MAKKVIISKKDKAWYAYAKQQGMVDTYTSSVRNAFMAGHSRGTVAEATRIRKIENEGYTYFNSMIKRAEVAEQQVLLMTAQLSDMPAQIKRYLKAIHVARWAIDTNASWNTWYKNTDKVVGNLIPGIHEIGEEEM